MGDQIIFSLRAQPLGMLGAYFNCVRVTFPTFHLADISLVRICRQTQDTPLMNGINLNALYMLIFYKKLRNGFRSKRFLKKWLKNQN